MLVQKAEHARPRLLAGLGVKALGTLFVEKAVLRLIAKQLIVRLSVFERCFERVHCLWRTPIVLVGKMPLQWDVQVSRVSGFCRRNAIETYTRVKLWDFDASDDGECPTHAEAHDCCTPAAGFQVLRGPAHVLLGSADPVKSGHEVVGFIWFRRHPSMIQIRCQGVKPCGRKAIAHPADLRVESPPLLDNHDMFCAPRCWGQVTGDIPAVWSCV